MNNSRRYKVLVDSGKTVFRPVDLQILWNEKPHNAKIYALRMTEKRLISRPAKGYYSLNDKYNTYEFANMIVTPSYVSFDSALYYHNLNFQIRNDVSSVAKINYQKKVGAIIYKYFSMKKELFYNMEGVLVIKNVSIASPERAVLDCFYFGFLPNIDNKDKLNTTYLNELSKFYPKSIQKKVKDLI